MRKQAFKKYFGYTAQVVIVLFGLFMLWIVGTDFYMFDVEHSDGSDDARWTVITRRWDYEDTIRLLGWGFYLLVTRVHLLLYFKWLSSMKKFNVWALPTFNISGMRILSAILSLLFIIFVLFFDINMPEVYTPTVSYLEYKEATCYTGIDSFFSFWIYAKWEVFTFFTAIHLLLFMLIKRKK